MSLTESMGSDGCDQGSHLPFKNSGSMGVDGKIDALNSAVAEMQGAFAEEDDGRAEIHLAVVTFGGTATLHTPLTPASAVRWIPMQADGRTVALATDGVADDLDLERLDAFTHWLAHDIGGLAPAARWHRLCRDLRAWPVPTTRPSRSSSSDREASREQAGCRDLHPREPLPSRARGRGRRLRGRGRPTGRQAPSRPIASIS